MTRTQTFVLVPVVALVLGGGFQVGRPLPPVQLGVAHNPIRLPGEFSVALPPEGQMAVGEEDLGVAAATPNQEPVAIASLAKMMTAYLLLQALPLKVGEDGPTMTLTPEDVQIFQKDRAAGDSIVRVAAGEKLTERQELEALLLPSADNIATLIARQVAGSEANFVTRMNQAAQQLGMTQTTYADAAGVNPATVSTANDQLRIAKAVMRDRIFREVVREPQADLPVAGLVYNVNFMVGKQGLTGVKTGSTLSAGSCFVGSFPITVGGAPHILLGAVLGQKSLHDALSYDVSMLHAVAPQFRDYTVPVPADGYARLSTAWRQKSRLEAAHTLKVFGYPGMPITVEAALTQTTLPIDPGQAVANLTLTAGSQAETLELHSVQGIDDPGIAWRLTR